METFRRICLVALITFGLVSCQGIVIGYKPPGIPLNVSVDTQGQISFSLETEVEYPTPLGTFSVGLVLDPAEYFGVENTLTIRFDGTDYFYDLHGQDFALNFQSGYYRQITLTKTGKTLLLQLDRVLGPTQVVVTETLPTNVTGEVSADPVQFVYDYYSAVNRRQYELTWSLLSDDYKNRNNGPDKGGYQGYVDFWNRISSVEVKTAYLVAQDASFAKVKAIIHYNLVQVGTEEYEITFHMVHSAVGSSWLIDATPTQKIGQ